MTKCEKCGKGLGAYYRRNKNICTAKDGTTLCPACFEGLNRTILPRTIGDVVIIKKKRGAGV
jgi:hypothetical protein